MAADESEDGESWRSSRATTNYLLGLLVVVTAAGFISIGDGYGGLGIVAELLLTLVLIGAIVLFIGTLMRDETE